MTTPTFPEPAWFLALGRLMETERERFLRLGYVETRFAVRVVSENGTPERSTAVVLDGYRVADAREISDAERFDPDFVICGARGVWQRMLDEIRRSGRPELRHTLNSLVLVGEELWLESGDQIREDKFYRFNQTLQEMFNLAARLPG